MYVFGSTFFKKGRFCYTFIKVYIYIMSTEGIFVAVGNSSLGEVNRIGYSTDGQVWTLATTTNNLFGGNGGGSAVAYGNGRFVAVGSSTLVDLNKIGYSTDGQNWTSATYTNNLFGGGGAGIGIAYGNGRFVAVGSSTSGEVNKIGYSTDGETWTLATNTNNLFDSGNGIGVAYGNSRFVAVGYSTSGEVNKIGYSTDGETWTLATNTNNLFGGGGAGIGIAYWNGRFVAVGSSSSGEVNKIGYSTNGEIWTLATNTNTLFGSSVNGSGLGITYGNGRFVAVGESDIGDVNKIGYSPDGENWTLATTTNNLFGGIFTDRGYNIAYGNGRFIAVGSSSLGEPNKIGYSPDGENWTLATTTNGLFGGGRGSGIAYGFRPIPTPITNICFPAGTPVQTDQGIINIEKLDKLKNTINQQSIKCITKTVTLDKYLISFSPHSIGRNIPFRKTIMTKDHKIEFDGRLVSAERFLDYSSDVKKVKYNGEILFNVLLENYGRMNVNGLVCETLHPENIIAKLYTNNYTEDERNTIIFQMNDSLAKRDLQGYKCVLDKLQQ